jgi:hypothetical protein
MIKFRSEIKVSPFEGGLRGMTKIMGVIVKIWSSP